MNDCTLTPDAIVECFQHAGYRALLVEFDDDLLKIQSSCSGQYFDFLIISGKNGPFKGIFQCITVEKITLEQANALNRNSTCIKTYVDEEGDAVFQWDTILYNSSKEQIKSLLDEWEFSLGNILLEIKGKIV